MARIVIVGAGVGGLGAALYAGRAGHDVVLVERDDTPLPPDPHAAFRWDRRGAPQVRHSHAFLARLRNQLRDDHPDVLARLLANGATEMDFIAMLPEGMDRTPMPGDEDLVALACRRTTFEWVLRSTVIGEGSATLLHGTALERLLPGPEMGSDLIPSVVGARLADGTELHADAVVLAGGRRMDVPALCRDVRAGVAEREEDTGIVYLSRFFRLHNGSEYPRQSGPIGGDLGYLKYGVFPGDDRTFSVTLAVPTHDTELRRRLSDPDLFLAAAAQLPPTAEYVDGRAEPITAVEVMGGLINRRRDFLADGEPVVTGVHAVGDAHTATNPLYGRGCSLAFVQAALLSEALDEHGCDGRARAVGYEQRCATEILPWHRAAVAQDRMARATSRAGDAMDRATDTAGADDRSPPAGADDGAEQAEFLRSLMRDGLLPAMRVDPVVLRAFLAMFNLLEPPKSLMENPAVIGRVMAVYQDRDERPPEPPLGPDRAELFAAVA